MDQHPVLPPSLSVAIDGDVAVLTIRRPEKRNALDDATVEGLARALDDLPDAVRAAVLHGEGEHFSAGLDLSEVSGDGDVADGILHSRMCTGRSRRSSSAVSRSSSR